MTPINHLRFSGESLPVHAQHPERSFPIAPAPNLGTSRSGSKNAHDFPIERQEFGEVSRLQRSFAECAQRHPLKGCIKKSRTQTSRWLINRYSMGVIQLVACLSIHDSKGNAHGHDSSSGKPSRPLQWRKMKNPRMHQKN